MVDHVHLSPRAVAALDQWGAEARHRLDHNVQVAAEELGSHDGNAALAASHLAVMAATGHTGTGQGLAQAYAWALIALAEMTAGAAKGSGPHEP